MAAPMHYVNQAIILTRPFGPILSKDGRVVRRHVGRGVDARDLGYFSYALVVSGTLQVEAESKGGGLKIAYERS
jgi:hypothetical protein